MHKRLIFIFTLGCSAFAAGLPLSPEDILKQERPASWPEWVDVEMDESILSDDALKKSFSESLTQAPSLFLEVAEGDLFGPSGIYSQEVDGKKERLEVSAKATYWHPKKEGFVVNCGIRVHGNRNLLRSPKLNFRLRMGKPSGEGPLAYSLFSEGIENFQNLLILNPTDDSWTIRKRDGEKAAARYVNDRWALDTARILGNHSPRQEWVHVYLNRIYWGVYALSERPDEHFAAMRRGGTAEDYDVFHAAEIQSGSDDQRKRVETFLDQEFENSPESLKQLEELVDLTAFIDHLICQIYQGKWDWPEQNYFLIGRRKASPRFALGAWDSESGFYEKSLKGQTSAKDALYFSPLSSTRFLSDRSGAGFWYRRLIKSPEFRLRFADHFHHLIAENGFLSPSRAANRYRSLLQEGFKNLREGEQVQYYQEDTETGLQDSDVSIVQ